MTDLYECECGDTLRCFKPLAKCTNCGKLNGYEKINNSGG